MIQEFDLLKELDEYKHTPCTYMLIYIVDVYLKITIFQGELTNQFITYQVLSEDFILEHSDKLDIKLQRKTHHDNRTNEEKLQEMEAYALEHNLDFKDGILIAY